MKTLLLTTAVALAASTALTSGAQAQAYGPRPAYAASGYDYSGGCGPGFTLAGAHAGVTVLGIDVGAGAALNVGLHGRCHASAPPVVYAPPPEPAPAYPPPGYGDVGYPGQAYGGGYAYGGQAAYGPVGGGGYVYAAPSYYPRPCGC